MFSLDVVGIVADYGFTFHQRNHTQSAACVFCVSDSEARLLRVVPIEFPKASFTSVNSANQVFVCGDDKIFVLSPKAFLA